MPLKLFSCLLCSYNIDKLQHVCSSCYELLPWNYNICRVCSVELTYSSICAKCRIEKPNFKIIAPFRYDKIPARLIKNIKYYGAIELSSFFAEALVNYLLTNAYLTKVDVLVPVPLFHSRQRKRGFNQAIELAKEIGKLLDIGVDIFASSRIKNTPTQTKYSSPERHRNLQGAFTANIDFTGMRVVVVDDVVTTAATVSALADAIYAAGALSVQVWAIARA